MRVEKRCFADAVISDGGSSARGRLGRPGVLLVLAAGLLVGPAATAQAQGIFWDFDTTGPTTTDEILDFFDLYGFEPEIEINWNIDPNLVNAQDPSGALHTLSNANQLEFFFSRVAIITDLEAEDVEISADITWDDNDNVGLYLRFIEVGDPNDPLGSDYYHVRVGVDNGPPSSVTLYRVRDGFVEELMSMVDDPFPISEGETHNVSFRAAEDELFVLIDDEPVTGMDPFVDPDPLVEAGRVGVGQETCPAYFDNLTVDAEFTCAARREISTRTYRPGEKVTVTLSARDLEGATTITETFPVGWTVSNPGGGTVSDNTIAFNLNAAGEVTYELTAPAGVCEDVTLSGALMGAGGCAGEVSGASQLSCSCGASRAISPTRYTPGEKVTVTLTATNITGATTLTETFPMGWTVSNEGGGTVTGNNIAFNLNADGEMTYELSVPDNFCERVTVSGTIMGAGGCEGDVDGDSAIQCVDNNLAGLWLFDEDGGDVVEDSSGNGHDGMFFDDGFTTTWEEGFFGAGLRFDGSGNFVNILHNEIFNFGPDDDFSMGYWVDAETTDANVFIKRNGGWWAMTASLDEEDGTFRFEYGARDSFIDNVATTTMIVGDGWHHCVAVRRAGILELWVDGVLESESDLTGVDMDSEVDVVIGGWGSENLVGRIDEVFVTQAGVAFTEDEINEIMNDGWAKVLEPEPVGTSFKRGDVDASGVVNITDGVFFLNNLFAAGPAPTCDDAADANDDGQKNITDAVFIFNFLFVGGPPPPPPGTVACGLDETDDNLECASYENC